MQRHHLKTRRKDRDAIESICRECHKTIHGLFTHSELRDRRLELDTIDGLLRNETFRSALAHIRKLAPGSFMRMYHTRERRRRR